MPAKPTLRCLARLRLPGRLLSLAWLLLGLGCGAGGGGGSGPEGGAVPGPWVIPADVLAAGDAQHVENTQPGAWPGLPCSPCTEVPGCAGGLRPGAVALSAQLRARFPQIRSVSGYCCRDICRTPPTGRMSVHGTGRALDLLIPLVAGEANNAQGDEIGSWLIERAEAIGIQLIVWDYWSWDGSAPPGAKGQPFTAESPHTDHLHVELSVEGAELRTPWFSGSRP